MWTPLNYSLWLGISFWSTKSTLRSEKNWTMSIFCPNIVLWLDKWRHHLSARKFDYNLPLLVFFITKWIQNYQNNSLNFSILELQDTRRIFFSRMSSPFCEPFLVIEIFSKISSIRWLHKFILKFTDLVLKVS